MCHKLTSEGSMTICRVSRAATAIGLILLSLGACGRSGEPETAVLEPATAEAATTIGAGAEAVVLDEYGYSAGECLCSAASAQPELPLVYAGASEAVSGAARLFEDERFDDSLVAFELILAENGGLPEDYFNRGVVHLRLALLDEAIVDFARAIELDPNLAAAHLNLGITYFRSRDGESALRHVAIAIEKAPDYARAYWNQGRMLGMQTDYEAGLASFDMAVKLGPDDPINLMGRGLAYANVGRFGDSRADFEAALALTDDPAVTVPIETALRDMPEADTAD